MNRSRLFAALLAALLVFAAALPAFADLIVEPQGSFYEEHADECTHTDTCYYVPKSGGGVALYNKPNGRTTGALPTMAFTGTEWFYTDEDGMIWGYNDHTNPEFAGWFKLLSVWRLYDSHDFEAEHASELFDRDGAGEGVESAVFYMYPQGPLLSDPAEERDLTNAEFVQLGRCYTDDRGRTWCEISYCYGQERGWICLDSPVNTYLTTGERPLMDPFTGERTGENEPEATEGQSAPRQTIDPNKSEDFNDSREGSKTASKKIWPIVGIVAAAAAVCAAVLAVVFKKEKKK